MLRVRPVAPSCRAAENRLCRAFTSARSLGVSTSRSASPSTRSAWRCSAASRVGSRSHPATDDQHLQHADQHGGAAGRVLPDHVEHRIHQPVVIDGRPHQRRAAVAQHDAGGQVQRHRVAQGGAQPVQHAHGRVRVVDARRQGADRDLHQLPDRELQVAGAGALAAHGRVVPDGGIGARHRPGQRGDRGAGKHVVAGPDQQAHGRAAASRPNRPARSRPAAAGSRGVDR